MTPLAWAAARNSDATLPSVPSLKQLRIELAMHAGKSTICWPSIHRLMKRTSLGERTIRRGLRVMEQLGELVTEVRRGRSCTSLYRLVMCEAAPRPAIEIPGQYALGLGSEKPAMATEKPAMVAPESNQVEELKKASELRSAPASAGAPDEVQEINALEGKPSNPPADDVPVVVTRVAPSEPPSGSGLLAEAAPKLAVVLAEAAPPWPAVLSEIPDPRKQVWNRGVRIVRELIGLSDQQAHGFVGRMLKEARDDCAAVMAILEEAADLRPIEPRAWLMKAARERGTPFESNTDRLMRDLRAEWGIPQPEETDEDRLLWAQADFYKRQMRGGDVGPEPDWDTWQPRPSRSRGQRPVLQ